MGARDFLTPPFGAADVGGVLDDLRKVLKEAPVSYSATKHIYSFLPAKPGVGATTVAINTSVAFQRESGQKVLLSDLDLACGVVRFLLKLPQELSIVDALARAEEMDTFLWPQLVAERDGIDVLHSGGVNPQAFLEIAQVQGLIDFARCNYGGLFFDMSGNLERHSMYVMQESKLVFVVCNPDLGSLYQGRERIQFLSSMGLGARLRAVVNRANQALALPLDRVSDFLGVPLTMSFSNETAEANQAIQRAQSLFGNAVRPGRLCKQYEEFARLLLNQQQEESSKAAASRELALAK
jgi:Flp pilus assembly CpaE family ATPase